MLILFGFRSHFDDHWLDAEQAGGEERYHDDGGEWSEDENGIHVKNS